jgi:hypothetical protein
LIVRIAAAALYVVVSHKRHSTQMPITAKKIVFG